MRAIELPEKKERKQKRILGFFSIFLLAIMIFGTVGYALMYRSDNNSSGSSDSNTKIKDLGGKWQVSLENGYTSLFSNSPEMVSNVSINAFLTKSMFSSSSSPLYIASKNTAVYQELEGTMRYYSPRVQPACYGPCEENYPEKNCSTTMIVWSDSTENKVYQQDNCIFIEGDMRAVDAFLYRFIGFSSS